MMRILKTVGRNCKVSETITYELEQGVRRRRRRLASAFVRACGTQNEINKLQTFELEFAPKG